MKRSEIDDSSLPSQSLGCLSLYLHPAYVLLLSLSPFPLQTLIPIRFFFPILFYFTLSYLLIDIASEEIAPAYYKKEEDPKLFTSKKTGRGPLTGEWKKTVKPQMCIYKLTYVEFKVWGLQTTIESWLQKVHNMSMRKKAICIIEYRVYRLFLILFFVVDIVIRFSLLYVNVTISIPIHCLPFSLLFSLLSSITLPPVYVQRRSLVGPQTSVLLDGRLDSIDFGRSEKVRD